ncbi:MULTISPECIES: hypothetical protein [unclassified Streptomyces]|uniref:hypothetical protein n=1 Tax=unclassified Streptomyces TaxID=2593676 RepID=UPI0033E7EB8E
MPTRDPARSAGRSALAELRTRLAGMKTSIIKGVLAAVVVLGVAADLIDPVGDVLRDRPLLGTSFGSLVALVLFGAITDTSDDGDSGVDVFGTLGDLGEPAKEAFAAKHVRIYFSGFTMQTLHDVIRDRLIEVADGSLRPRALTLHIIVVHLNSPMNLPGVLSPAPSGEQLLFDDSPVNRERMREDYTLKYWESLRALLDDIRRRHPRMPIECEVRESPHGPQFKLYILNEERAIYGTYGIKENTFTRGGQEHRILDAAGFNIMHADARYLGWSVRSRSKSTRQVANYHMAWFENLWNVLDRVKPAAPVIPDPVWQPPSPGGPAD